MVFSSNQILEVSGDLLNESELVEALSFALSYSGHLKNLKQQETDETDKLIYQITEDGKYCVGWYYKEIPDGWKKYDFDFDIEIVSKIIRQHLKSSSVKKGDYDGSYEKGFLMKCISESFVSEQDGIRNPFYGIVYFEPYTCFYSK